MKKRLISKGLATAALLLAGVTSFGQEAEVAVREMPIYEKLGISSTSLCFIMVVFTLILLGFVMSMASSTKNVLKYREGQGKGGLKTLLILAGITGSSSAMAAGEGEALIGFPDSVFWAFMVVDIVLIMIIIYFSGIIRGVISEYSVPKKLFTWNKWTKSMTDAVPIEQEGNILLDHDYDGIRELDNNLPPWWKYGFYITIVWAFGYVIYYHMGSGVLQEEEYLTEMEEGELAVAAYKEAHPELITEENVTLLTDQAAIAEGADVYNTNCIACHAEGGKGGIGPNLTDKEWIYGGDIKGVFHTISEGASNGMVAWKEMLPANKIQAVASYILQLEYVAPPEGKEPQGENIVE